MTTGCSFVWGVGDGGQRPRVATPGFPREVQDAILRLGDTLAFDPGRVGWYAGPVPGAPGWLVAMATRVTDRQGDDRVLLERAVFAAPAGSFGGEPPIAWWWRVPFFDARDVEDLAPVPRPPGWPPRSVLEGLADPWWHVTRGAGVRLPVDADPSVAAAVLGLAPPGPRLATAVALGLTRPPVRAETPLLWSAEGPDTPPEPAPDDARTWFREDLLPFTEIGDPTLEVALLWRTVEAQVGPVTTGEALRAVARADAVLDHAARDRTSGVVRLDHADLATLGPLLADEVFAARLLGTLAEGDPAAVYEAARHLAASPAAGPHAALLAWEACLRGWDTTDGSRPTLPPLDAFGDAGVSVGCLVLAALARRRIAPLVDVALDVVSDAARERSTLWTGVRSTLGGRGRERTRREALLAHVRGGAAAATLEVPRPLVTLGTVTRGGPDVRAIRPRWTEHELGAWMDQVLLRLSADRSGKALGPALLALAAHA